MTANDAVEGRLGVTGDESELRAELTDRIRAEVRSELAAELSSHLTTELRAGKAAEIEVAREGGVEPEGGLNSPHRLLALVDGVFAIAMTLLALDVRIPDAVKETPKAFAHAAPAFYGDLGVFLVAFLITSRFWLAHHRCMARVHTVDTAVLERTMSFLAGISSIPVATAVLFRFGGVPQAIAFASFVLAVTTLLGARLWWYVSDPVRGLSDDDPQTRLPRLLHLIWNAIVYLLAIPVALTVSAFRSGSESHVSWSMTVWVLLSADGLFTTGVLWIRARFFPEAARKRPAGDSAE